MAAGAPTRIDLKRTPTIGTPLKDQFHDTVLNTADGWVDDARLVLLNALDARERGATVLTRCPCTHVQRSAQRLAPPHCTRAQAHTSPYKHAHW
jgi:glycerol-3-phosphate dehydrogenase